MLINITEQEIESQCPGAMKAENLDAEECNTLVQRLLPSIVAKRFHDALPKGFEVKTIAIEAELCGNPFGVGVKGKVQVVLENRRPVGGP